MHVPVTRCTHETQQEKFLSYMSLQDARMSVHYSAVCNKNQKGNGLQGK